MSLATFYLMLRSTDLSAPISLIHGQDASTSRPEHESRSIPPEFISKEIFPRVTNLFSWFFVTLSLFFLLLLLSPHTFFSAPTLTRPPPPRTYCLPLHAPQFNFGGFANGMGGGRPAPRREVDNKGLYASLGVESTADENEIKRAFRRQAMQHHPDKGGDPEKFKEINRAYEILSDKDKRAIYDEGGEEALERGGGGGGADMSDMFDLFGGGGRRRRGTPQKRRGEDVIFPLVVTLEDMYRSATKKLRLSRNVICKGCNGRGGSVVQSCEPCQGNGVRVVLRQIGPGMVAQSQVQCSACNGQGQVIPRNAVCGDCKGKKVVKDGKILEVYIPKGARHDQRVVFQGEADEAPDTVTGDVIVVLQQKPHDVFQRRGNHLVIKQTISLTEALGGFKSSFRHLDNRIIVVDHSHSVVKPGTITQIEDEGMPIPDSHHPGNLYIEFTVEFPDAVLPAAALATVGKSLPRPRWPAASVPNSNDNPEVEEVECVDVNEAAEEARFEREKELEEEAEAEERERNGEGHHHGGGPACQQA